MAILDLRGFVKKEALKPGGLKSSLLLSSGTSERVTTGAKSRDSIRITYAALKGCSFTEITYAVLKGSCTVLITFLHFSASWQFVAFPNLCAPQSVGELV
jgi:hypothetical protein